MIEPPEKKALSMPSVLLLMSRDDSVQILEFAVASVSVPLNDVYINIGTLDDARIHMGIPLALHDVCVIMGPSMMWVRLTLANTRPYFSVLK